MPADEPADAGMNRPRASVVMTVYNDLRFLDEAVDSVLRQQFEDFELIIVDDATGDEAVSNLRHRDPRIRVHVNERNAGSAAAGNRGIAEARADIVVRLDADDAAEPARIGRLVAELDRDPELGLVGSSVTLIDEEGRAQGVQVMPPTDIEIRWTILFHNPFYHPSVAFRKSCYAAAGGYKEDELVSHDHYLWFRMLDVARARNVAEPLLRYRQNPRGLTVQHSKNNPRARTHAIRQELWKRLGLTCSLYDNPLASDVSGFLRGFDIEPDRRAAAYELLRTTLHAFAATMQPHVRGDEPDSLRELIVARMRDKPASAGSNALRASRSDAEKRLLHERVSDQVVGRAAQDDTAGL